MLEKLAAGLAVLAGACIALGIWLVVVNRQLSRMDHSQSFGAPHGMG